MNGRAVVGATIVVVAAVGCRDRELMRRDSHAASDAIAADDVLIETPVAFDKAGAIAGVRKFARNFDAAPGSALGVLPVQGVDEPGSSCSFTDSCVWAFWIAADDPGELRPLERCEVHAVTGIVRCADWPASASAWRVVGQLQR